MIVLVILHTRNAGDGMSETDAVYFQTYSLNSEMHDNFNREIHHTDETINKMAAAENFYFDENDIYYFDNSSFKMSNMTDAAFL